MTPPEKIHKSFDTPAEVSIELNSALESMRMVLPREQSTIDLVRDRIFFLAQIRPGVNKDLQWEIDIFLDYIKNLLNSGTNISENEYFSRLDRLRTETQSLTEKIRSKIFADVAEIDISRGSSTKDSQSSPKTQQTPEVVVIPEKQKSQWGGLLWQLTGWALGNSWSWSRNSWFYERGEWGVQRKNWVPQQTNQTVVEAPVPAQNKEDQGSTEMNDTIRKEQVEEIRLVLTNLKNYIDAQTNWSNSSIDLQMFSTVLWNLLREMWPNFIKKLKITEYKESFIADIQAVQEITSQIQKWQKSSFIVRSNTVSDLPKFFSSLYKKREEIVRTAKTAQEQLVTSLWIKEKDWYLDFRVDDSIEKIDNEISQNLFLEDRTVKSESKLKGIWLSLIQDIDFKQTSPNNEQIQAYKERLSQESIEELKRFYNTSSKEQAITKFIIELKETLWENMKDTAKEIETLLNSNDTTIIFQWKKHVFQNLQEKNFALTSVLYFIKWFAEDIEDPGFIFWVLQLWWMIAEWIIALSSFWLSKLLWDYTEIFSAVFWTLLLGSHILLWGNNKIPGTSRQKLQQEYNNLTDKSTFFENDANPWYKDRFDLLDMIKKWVKIEANAWRIPMSVFTDLENFEKSYFTIKNDELFYSRLFKIIHSYEWNLAYLRMGLKFTIVPWWLGIIEDFRWAPIWRWITSRWWLFLWRTLFNWNLGVRWAFDPLGSRRWWSIDLNKDVETFKGYLLELKDHFKWIVKLDIFKHVRLDDRDKGLLLDQMRQEIDDIDVKDTASLDAIDAVYQNINRIITDIDTKERALGEFSDSAKARVTQLIRDIGTLKSTNFLSKLEELQTETNLLLGEKSTEWINSWKWTLSKLWDVWNISVLQDIKTKIKSWLISSDIDNNTIANIDGSLDKIIGISHRLDDIDRNNKIQKELIGKIWLPKEWIESLDRKTKWLEDIIHRIKWPYTQILDEAFKWEKVDWNIIKWLENHFKELDEIKEVRNRKTGEVTDTVEQQKIRVTERFFKDNWVDDVESKDRKKKKKNPKWQNDKTDTTKKEWTNNDHKKSWKPRSGEETETREWTVDLIEDPENPWDYTTQEKLDLRGKKKVEVNARISQTEASTSEKPKQKWQTTTSDVWSQEDWENKKSITPSKSKNRPTQTLDTLDENDYRYINRDYIRRVEMELKMQGVDWFGNLEHFREDLQVQDFDSFKTIIHGKIRDGYGSKFKWFGDLEVREWGDIVRDSRFDKNLFKRRIKPDTSLQTALERIRWVSWEVDIDTRTNLTSMIFRAIKTGW